MKEAFDNAISTAIAKRDTTYFGSVVRELCTKYQLSAKTIHNRFHSMYGNSFQAYVTPYCIPSKEALTAAVLSTSSSEECRVVLGISNRMFNGLYDKYFGVSTYASVKAKILLQAPLNVRKSQLREDNLAILMSQYIGDGHYDRSRHALRIIHGEKQLQYLHWKVGLIHAGYNKASQVIKLHTHSQGHKYGDYYSGKLGHVVFPEDKASVVQLLTPLGWLLWYLDDGTYGQDISICTNLEAVALAAQQELATYGIKARVNKCSDKHAYLITMCGIANTVQFYKNFIESFLDCIPSCMLYKTKVKI